VWRFSRKDVCFFAIVILIPLVSFAVYSPKIFFEPDAYVSDLGDGVLNLWMLEHTLNAIDHLSWDALWQANIFFPFRHTMALSDTLLFQALVAYLPWKLGVPTLLLMNLETIVFYVLNFLCCVRLIMILGWGRTASLLGAIFATCHFYWFSHLPHFQLLATFWYPLLVSEVLLHYRSASSQRAVSIFLCLIGLIFTSPYLFVLFLVSLMILVLVCVYLRRQRRYLFGLCTALGCAAIVAAAYYSPYHEISKNHEVKRDLYEQANFAGTTASWRNAAGLRVQKILDLKPQRRSESTAYISLANRSFLICGFLYFLYQVIRRRTDVLFVRWIVFLSGYFLFLWLAYLGPLSSWHIAEVRVWTILNLLPGYSGIRVPARLAFKYYYVLGLIVACFYHHMRRSYPTLSRGLAILGLLHLMEMLPNSYLGAIFPSDYYQRVSNVLRNLHSTTGQPEPVLILPPIDRRSTIRGLPIYYSGPIVGGTSGFMPAVYEYILEPAYSPCVDTQCSMLIDKLGVKHILFTTPPTNNPSYAYVSSLAGFKRTYWSKDLVVFSRISAVVPPPLLRGNIDFLQLPRLIQYRDCEEIAATDITQLSAGHWKIDANAQKFDVLVLKNERRGMRMQESLAFTPQFIIDDQVRDDVVYEHAVDDDLAYQMTLKFRVSKVPSEIHIKAKNAWHIDQAFRCRSF
jgi:hypothetical protein